MILADASVWIDHFHGKTRSLSPLLPVKQILIHPFILGELALGHVKNRAQVLLDLQRLPKAVLASDEEVLNLVEAHRLYGKGLGWIDCHLIASTLLSHAELWTGDKHLRAAASLCGVKLHGPALKGPE